MQTYLIVDDSPIDVFIAEKILKNIRPDSELIKFGDAAKALDFLRHNDTVHKPAIILLDIYMPTIDGFGFLEEFHHLPPQVKEQYQIYIVSSSSNQIDIARARSNPYVTQMLQKPLTKESLLNLLP